MIISYFIPMPKTETTKMKILVKNGKKKSHRC